MCINSEMKKILVTGGAGYIGSHFCKLLSKAGFTPVVVDNLSRGNLQHVRFGPFYNCDVRDLDSLMEILRRERPDVVAHFAGYAYVNESVQNPDLYLSNNIFGTSQLVKACAVAGVDRILFSSSCAVYGDSAVPLKEDSELRPINPYGYSKLIGENILREFVANKTLIGAASSIAAGAGEVRKAIALRYFNAAGADSNGELGAIHQPESRIIPLILKAALDPNYTLSIFGDNHPTNDGTCVRDFIHVEDLCRAHLLAVEDLLKEDYSDKEGRRESTAFTVFNVGSGHGHSILQVIQSVEEVTGKTVKFRKVSANKSESSILVAESEKIKNSLGFVAEKSQLNTIINSALSWYLKGN